MFGLDLFALLVIGFIALAAVVLVVMIVFFAVTVSRNREVARLAGATPSKAGRRRYVALWTDSLRRREVPRRPHRSRSRHVCMSSRASALEA